MAVTPATAEIKVTEATAASDESNTDASNSDASNRIKLSIMPLVASVAQ